MSTDASDTLDPDALAEIASQVAGPPPPDVYVYEEKYYMQDADGAWRSNNRSMLSMQLRSLGLHPNEIILNALRENRLDYAGPVAGYGSGFRRFGKVKVLVTRGCELPVPVHGGWPTVEEMLLGALGTEQLPFFYSWLKVMWDNLRSGVPGPGQAMCLCGPPRGGKTLLSQFVVQVFGGRKGMPYQFLSGGTPFNGDLMGAETLVIDDEQGGTSPAVRRQFGQKLKNMLFASSQRVHRKGEDAFGLPVIQRIIVCLNLEAEDVKVLPPLGDSIKDKLMLLKVDAAKMPMPTRTAGERDAFWSRLMDELPAFVEFIENIWQIPPELVAERTGVRHFHHPEVVKLLNEQDEAAILFDWIESLLPIIQPRGEPWTGTAVDLYQQLVASGASFGNAVPNPGACARYLGQLEQRFPDRFSRVRTANNRIWKITFPKPGGPE